MRKTITSMQRLLALILAFVMVLGYVPVPAAAEEEAVVLLRAELSVNSRTGGEAIETEPAESLPGEENSNDSLPEETEPTEPAPVETTPYMYTYRITVTDKDGNDVTEQCAITWDGLGEGPVSQETSSDLVSAAVVYDGLKLTVDSLDSNTAWTDMGVTWASIMATSAITAPKINEGGHASLSSEPTWEITDKNGEPVAADAVAKLSMETLTATATIAGHTFTATTTVTPVPVTVSNVTPVAGWYAALPQAITVHGTAVNNAGIDDIDKTLHVNGEDCQWTGDNGVYSYTFVPVQNTNTIGGKEYTWNVDDVEPRIPRLSAYIDDSGDTVVKYGYDLGPSGGTITINGQVVEDAIGEFVLDGAHERIIATITNNLVAPKSSSAECLVVPYPSLAYEATGKIAEIDGATYVKSNAVYTFTIQNAYGNVEWTVNDAVIANASGAVLNVNAAEYDGQDLSVKATDASGRSVSRTVSQITVDVIAPEISIVAPEDEPTDIAATTHFAKEREYTIQITDNAGLGTCEATATINGNAIPVTFVGGQGKVTVKDGQTLTAITVTAVDQNGNTTNAVHETNIHVDTTAPVITGTISVTYSDGTLGEINKLFKQGETTYLVLDVGANNENDLGKRNVIITAVYRLKEANPDEATAAAWGDNMTIIQTVAVAKNSVTEIELSVGAKDKAGNIFEAENIALGQNIVLEPNDDGTYSMVVIADRRTPEDKVKEDELLPEEPHVSLFVDSDHSYTLDGVRYFKGDMKLEMNIQDGDSGLEYEDKESDEEEKPYANIRVEASGAYVVDYSQEVRPDANGNAKIGMKIAEGKEATDGKIQLRIYDNVGNYYFYNEEFAVDSRAPRVAVELSSGDSAPEVFNGVDLYQQPVVLTFTIEDQLPCEAAISYTIDGLEQTQILSSSGNPVTIEINAGEKLTDLSVSATDRLNNTTSSFSDYTFVNAIEVDGTPAVATVDIFSEGALKATADGIAYYDKPVKVTVSVADKNINAASEMSEAMLTYTIDDGNAQEVDLLQQEGKTFTIEVENNHVLTDLKLVVVDDAGNKTEVLENVAYSYSSEKNQLTYTGNQLAVDMTEPVITVVKTLNEATHIQTVGTDPGTAYYADGTVTYTVTITDAFLNEEVSSILFNGAGKATFAKGEGPASAEDKMTLEFVVTDDTVLNDITIVSQDTIGLFAKEITFVDPLGDLAFSRTEKTFTYTGPDVVADTIAPSAMAVLEGNIDSLVKKNGVYYVKIKEPVDKNLEGIFKGAEKETVKLILTVTDTNLTLDNTVKEKTFISSNIEEKNWSLSEDGKTVTYTDSVEVPLHGNGYIKIDVAAYDLVGHPMELNTIRNGATEGQEMEVHAADNGIWQATISLDRRTPSSEDDDIPEIILTDEDSEKYKTLGGLDLYADDFDFNLFVKDGKGEEEDEKHAGLKSVGWVLEDSVNAIVVGANTATYEDEYVTSYNNPIAVDGKGDKGSETDNAKLTITAVDNVDNTIQYSKDFAFDDLAPRVTVTIDGTSVRNNEYYNKTRTARVEIVDLHMPELDKLNEYVTVKTQGTASGWTQENATTYTNTFTFAADGEYTFAVTVKDIAGNVTEDAEVQYVGENPRAFVIDQTNPVLTVHYAPGTPSGRDNQGVLYYAQDVTATVTITELNFQAADVVARFNNTNAGLGAWSNDLDHHASVTFGQGNRYSFDISFQDLAGNQAEVYQSPVFSVDTTAPTVVVSSGNLKEGQLNIVPDDLTLALTVNDAQHNLSNYTVTVTHLDNNFKKTVVSGAEYYTVQTQEDRTTVVINFSKIAKEKIYDGLYTVEVSAQDYAGNSVSLNPDITFSLNRYGSTFTTDDEFTLNFLTTGEDGNAYHKGIDKKLVIQEINPNKVWQNDKMSEAGSSIIVMVNGTSTELKAGKDYKCSVSEEGNGNTKWYVYTYEIEPEAFESKGKLVDGRYAILLYGVDEAGNKNTNEANESGKLQKNVEGNYSGKIEFVLDSTAPIITTTGIESRKNYNAEEQQLKIFLSDNTPAAVVVYLNGEEVKLTDALVQMNAGLVYDEEAGCYILNVPEQNTLFAGQNIKIMVTDAAGNEAVHDITDFSVSTNFVIRMLNSTWFIVGIIALLLMLALCVILLLRKRSKGKQTSNMI